MSKLQLTPEEYLTEIIMSKDAFLLLEGSDDEKFFIAIYNNLKNISPKLNQEKLNAFKKIRIETAEQIKGSLGNREKVENICQLVLEEKESIRKRILGFVDREFREFDYNNSLQDNLKTHQINGRLIWSRGHSIENYLFEIATWRETFNGYPVTRLYQEAFEIFESKFSHTLRIACSLSLAGLSEDLLQVIQNTLDWKYIDITSQSVSINLQEWKKRLKSKHKLDQTRIDNLIDKFTEYLEITDNHDLEIVRWLSHGHIGFNLMFAVYGKCLYTVALSEQIQNPDQEADKVNKNQDMRFMLSVNSWTRNQSFESQTNPIKDFPIKCFWMLTENMGETKTEKIT